MTEKMKARRAVGGSALSYRHPTLVISGSLHLIFSGLEFDVGSDLLIKKKKTACLAWEVIDDRGGGGTDNEEDLTDPRLDTSRYLSNRL